MIELAPEATERLALALSRAAVLRTETVHVDASDLRSLMPPMATARAFRLGAQACREMMARFVEEGGNPAIANIIRLNWHPGWGEDPGEPDEVATP